MSGMEADIDGQESGPVGQTGQGLTVGDIHVQTLSPGTCSQPISVLIGDHEPGAAAGDAADLN